MYDGAFQILIELIDGFERFPHRAPTISKPKQTRAEGGINNQQPT